MSETLLIVGVGRPWCSLPFSLSRVRFGPVTMPRITPAALALGDRGWVQIANSLQLGAGMVAFAVGVYKTLNSVVGAVLLAIFGLGAIVAGVFRMDPMRGYPPGTPTGTPADLSWRHQVHDLAGPVMFLAICGACLAIARRLQGPWQVYTLLTAMAGLALTISTAVAWQKDAESTGFVQRALIVVYCSWIVMLGIHFL